MTSSKRNSEIAFGGVGGEYTLDCNGLEWPRTGSNDGDKPSGSVTTGNSMNS